MRNAKLSDPQSLESAHKAQKKREEIEQAFKDQVAKEKLMKEQYAQSKR